MLKSTFCLILTHSDLGGGQTTRGKKISGELLTVVPDVLGPPPSITNPFNLETRSSVSSPYFDFAAILRAF